MPVKHAPWTICSNTGCGWWRAIIELLADPTRAAPKWT